jgi:hypothetical protein
MIVLMLACVVATTKSYPYDGLARNDCVALIALPPPAPEPGLARDDRSPEL